ncbi:MAG: DegT/DnrJ/EryC1/StrS family aminotransferase [Nitrospiraceae bacterium]|nr:DegT/DnrJ/EryC1/StrS family aminotransferase [Nitrospiraceae bacterium]
MMTKDNMMPFLDTVPFLDLVTPHLEIEDELVSVFREALRSGRFIGGPAVDGFEEDFARFCETEHCVGVGSGTDALRFALIAAGVNPGDAVITVPNTFIATTEAISQAGAVPVFVDVDERTCNMDPEKLREYLETGCEPGGKTAGLVCKKAKRPVTAVIPVHLYGQMADMDAIMGLAAKYGLLVIEDACQAHGAQYFSKRENRWITAGSMGAAAAFSFYPGKNLGACGEAGAVTTGSPAMAGQIGMLRDHGQSKKYYHEIEGYNGRLDAIQAGFLQLKLKKLSQWNGMRRKNAALYTELLGVINGPGSRSACQIKLPYEPSWSKGVYHLYVVRTQMRDQLQGFLNENGIATGLHYPVPLHLQNAYKGSIGYKEGDFPVSEKLAAEMLSLPMYPGLTGAQAERVAGKMRDFFKSASKASASK